LHYAVKNNHDQVVRILLENGANVNAIAYEYRKRPLDVASNDEIKALLIAHGAKEDESCAMQ
jgi:ankyrin repeat protein